MPLVIFYFLKGDITIAKPEIKIKIIIKITEVLSQGIIGYNIQDKTYSVIKVIDKKFPKIFNKNDFAEILVEYITDEEFLEDTITDKEIVLYIMIYEFMPRGFYTKQYDKDINKFKKMAFYESRGYVVIPELETRNLFEVGDCIKIIIRKI